MSITPEYISKVTGAGVVVLLIVLVLLKAAVGPSASAARAPTKGIKWWSLKKLVDVGGLTTGLISLGWLMANSVLDNEHKQRVQLKHERSLDKIAFQLGYVSYQLTNSVGDKYNNPSSRKNILIDVDTTILNNGMDKDLEFLGTFQKYKTFVQYAYDEVAKEVARGLHGGKVLTELDVSSNSLRTAISDELDLLQGKEVASWFSIGYLEGAINDSHKEGKINKYLVIIKGLYRDSMNLSPSQADVFAQEFLNSNPNFFQRNRAEAYKRYFTEYDEESGSAPSEI